MIKNKQQRTLKDFFQAVLLIIFAVGLTLLVNIILSPTTITGLTTFSVSGTILNVTTCGQINQSTNLVGNIVVAPNAPCFNITNSSLVFNCTGGYNITGSFDGSANKALYAFNVTNGTKNITIQNCNIQNFSHGIWINRLNNETLVRWNNITNNTWGVYVDGGILHNITTNNLSVNNIALEWLTGGNGTVDFNVITRNNQTGLFLRSNVRNLNVTNNSIVDQQDPTTQGSGVGTQSLRILGSINILLRDNRIHNYSIQDVNLTVWYTDYGRIHFFPALSVDGMNFSRDINMTYNRIYVNSSIKPIGEPSWNVSATLTFFNLSSLVRLHPLVNITDDPSTTGFETCPPTGTDDAVTCTNITDQGENFTFDTNHFSTFTTTASMNCPALVNVTPTIRRNVNGTGVAPGQACLTINNNSINADCRGFSIIGNGSGIAINISFDGNTTINRCNILNFSNGINVSSSNTTLLLNSNITNTTEGVLLNNTVTTHLQNITATTTSGYGFYFTNSTDNNVTLSTSTSTTFYGVGISDGSNNRFSNTTHQGSIAIFTSNNARTHNFTNVTIIANTGFEVNGSDAITITNTSFQDSTNWSIRAAVGSNFSLIDNPRMTNYTFNRTPRVTITTTGAVSVTFFDIVEANGTNLSMDVNLSVNRTHVNSTRSPGLNVSANITLFNVGGFTNPQPILDPEDDGTFETCTSQRCTEQSYSNNIYVFNVSSFTTYAINETPSTAAAVTPPPSGGGGGSQHKQPPVIVLPPPTIAPSIAPPAPKITPLTVPAPTTITATSPESLNASSLGLINPISSQITETTPVACGFITDKISSDDITAQQSKISTALPQHYTRITEPFSLTCNGDDLDLTLTIPNNYTDLITLVCQDGICKPLNATNISTDFTCGGYSLDKIREAQIPNKQVSLLLSTLNISFQQRVFLTKNTTRIAIDTNKLIFTGYYPEQLPVTIFAPQRALPNPLNPDLHLIGIPMTIRIVINETPVIPTTLQLSYPDTNGLDINSLAVSVLQNNTWHYLGGTVNKNQQTVTVDLHNILDLRDEYNEATFALIGIVCAGCTETTLHKVYDGGTRNAIILVHGLLGSPATWQSLVDEYALTKQPIQLWTWAYPSTQPTQDVAEEFKKQLELYNNEYDSVSIVAHSLGGFVIQKALPLLEQPLRQKIKRVVIIGTPHDGTPAVSLYHNLYTFLSTSRTIQGLFDVNSQVLTELNKGINLPRQENIQYYVLAGTQPYDFNVQYFTAPNDGITTTTGAQHVGGTYINDTCKNYFQFNLTHTELVYQPIARRVIERITAEDLHQAAALGYNQYVRIKINDCKPEHRYVIVGKEIPPAATILPLNCACGNGVCGLGESDVTCPSDCALFAQTRETMCLLMPVIIPLLLVMLILLTLLYLVWKYALDKEHHSIALGTILFFFATFIITLFQNLACNIPLTFPYFILITIFVFIILDTLVRQKPPKKHFDAKPVLAIIYDIYRQLKELEHTLQLTPRNAINDLRLINKRFSTLEEQLQILTTKLQHAKETTQLKDQDTIHSLLAHVSKLRDYVKNEQRRS